MRALSTAFLLTLLFGGAAAADGYQDFNLGLTDRIRGDTDASIKSFTMALSEPDLPQNLREVTFLDRGTGYLVKKQFDAAISDFTSAIALRPDDILAYRERSAAFASVNQNAKAIDDISKAISLRPAYRVSYFQRIAMYAAMKDMNGAIADCTTLIGLYPNEPAMYRIRAINYRFNQNYDLAIADETSALNVNDKSVEDYRERGFDYEAKGDFAKAVDDFGSEARLAPEPSLAYLRKGQAQWDMGKFDDAGTSFEETLKRQPLQDYAFLWLTISHSKTSTATDSDTTARFSGADLSKWPGPLVALYLGKSSPADVDQAIKQSDAGLQKVERCAADFFVGEWQQMHQAAAAGKFQAALQDCGYDAIYRPAVTAETSRAAAR